jgi:N-acyl-D-aspartate/D-glutamate deacylase
MHDLLIRDALILDGLGGEPFHADLAVVDGRIAAIGRGLGVARETIAADGLALMPGIIDGHTHYDAQVTWDPWVDPSPALGVTTVVIGNCGFTIAPCREADRDLTMRNLTHVEGMSLEALRAGINWEFETFPEYLAMLERRGVGANVAAFVGHSSIRTYVLRDDASRRAATGDEIARMAALVREAMAAGAFGFASSTNEPHNGENGVPMPSRLADEREFRALVGAMAEARRGLFMLTKGATTEVSFLASLAAESRRPVLVAAMLHNPIEGGRVFEQVEAMKEAAARGAIVVPQVSPCPLTMEFTLESAYPFESFASWHPAMEASGAALRRLYADASFRDNVKTELVRTRGQRLFNSEWEKVHVVEAAGPESRSLEGKSIAELAAAAGKDPLDCLLDLALAEDLGTLFTAQLLNADEAAVGRLVADPATHVALSDAGAHLTFFCDAGYGLHLLGHWSRALGVLPLETAVWKLTGQPARLFGIGDRGALKPGFAADLLLFDPATVGRGPKRRVFDLPAGARRLTTPALGVEGVWVNGIRVADATGIRPGIALPGKVLRNFVSK